jgi:hypothetical protein
MTLSAKSITMTKCEHVATRKQHHGVIVATGNAPSRALEFNKSSDTTFFPIMTKSKLSKGAESPSHYSALWPENCCGVI